MSKLTQFAKFVGRYAGELRGVASLLETVFRSLPIDPADKARAVEVLENLNAAADRIEGSLSAILADGQISRDDLRKMISEEIARRLPDALGGAVETRARAATPARKPAAPKKAAPRKAARLPTAAETSTGG